MTSQNRMALIGKRLRHLRVTNNLTLKEAGYTAGCKPARYSNYEQGYRTPGLDEIEALGKFFKVDPAWIAGFTDQGPVIPDGESIQ